METTLRIKKAVEQEVYKRITVCVPQNVSISKVTTSSKPQIPERTPELGEGIAQSDLKPRFTHLNYEETSQYSTDG
ncbi:hypothetical protein L5515_015279 [Caenorhabditis briggsae]|uniref:Uncharacterized protein n=1 Tax=Caenorhabditis briggsae TaxID=6238 RepID=A0AAE9EDQ2_CAEBR|nr:hypothetical protein L5515_015279 [Caenorhabditis briggsae]